MEDDSREFAIAMRAGFRDGLPVQFAVDEAAGLEMISIRLDKSLIEDLKLMASRKGIGYQPLIRKILDRFVYKETEEFLRALGKVDEGKDEKEAD